VKNCLKKCEKFLKFVSLVSDVQRKCSKVMGEFGYKLVDPKSKKHHDYDHLITPWRNGMPPWVQMMAQGQL